MNRRHAAALALLGWYLMVPSSFTAREKGFLQAYEEPLSKWFAISAFDSAADCDAAKAALLKETQRHEKEIPRNQATTSQCIATDDRRLKEK